MRVIISAEDMITAFEIVRLTLENRASYDSIARQMDISDEELSRIYHKIMGFLDNDLRQA